MEENQVKLNEQVISKEEFTEKKERLESNKGVKVVEVSKDTYKTRIQG